MLLLGACQAPKFDIETADLEGLKKEQKSLQASILEQEGTLKAIEEKLLELEPPKEKPKKAVTSFIAKSETFKSYSELQGNIASSDAVMISAEMGGRITSLNLEEGNYVRKGQVVGTVDMETLKKSIKELETSLELATTVYERQKKLWDQQIGSEIQYLQAKNNKERLEKSMETTKSQLSKENIIAPMSGYVDMKFLKAGELTSSGAPIASVINTSSVKAVIDVPENLVSSVRKGDKVNVSFPALGTDRDARISMVGRSINPANRTFKIEVNLSNPKGLLKPNLMALTKINDQTIKDAVLIPTELVQQDVSGKSFVYIIAEGEEGPYAQKNLVTTGASYEGKIVIESGINAGDQVIYQGARGLAQNDYVIVKNENE